MRGTSKRLAALTAALLFSSATAQAHPMPDTEITVVRQARAVGLAIRVPVADLLLALPPESSRDPKVLLADNQAQLRAYFAAHTRLRGGNGVPVPVSIGTIRLRTQRDANVGTYAELEVIAAARVDGGAALALAYDGVLHRVANHRALVRGGNGQPVGIIRYSLATKAARPLVLPLARQR